MDRQIAHEKFREAIRPEATLFFGSLEDVSTAQHEIFTRILRENQATRFGIEHNFEDISTIAQYQSTVPIRGYDDLAQYVSEICTGKQSVLTREPVRKLHLSSGTSAASKLLPFTHSLAREFQSAIAPWLYSLYSRFPDIASGDAYWALTPSGGLPSHAPSVVPVGFDSEAAYFSPAAAECLPFILTFPESNLDLPSEEFLRSTVLGLLRNRTISWISVWSPTYLLTLWETFIANAPLFKQQLGPEIAPIIDACIGKSSFEPLWPDLKVVSCWGDAWAAQFSPAIKQLFPTTYIEYKGLLATEAVVTIPVVSPRTSQQSQVLAFRSHFYEFECRETKRVFLANELVEGHSYEVIVTTSGGLYRYRLYDVVRCEGYMESAPMLRFMGRANVVSDLCGEKLHEHHVEAAVSSALGNLSMSTAFRLVAPELTPRGYVLFVEPGSDVDPRELRMKSPEILRSLEDALSENVHYGYCRKLEQLSHVSMVLLEKGERARYLNLKSSGKRRGVLKTAALELSPSWRSRLSGIHITVHP